MEEHERRSRYIQLRLNEQEFQEIEEKFRNSGLKSKSEFIRVMLLEGLMIYFDDTSLKSLYRSINGAANNINQIAKRVNATGSIYEEDIADLRNGVNEIWQQLRSFRSLLQRAKPLRILQAEQKPKTDD